MRCYSSFIIPVPELAKSLFFGTKIFCQDPLSICTGKEERSGFVHSGRKRSPPLYLSCLPIKPILSNRSFAMRAANRFHVTAYIIYLVAMRPHCIGRIRAFQIKYGRICCATHARLPSFRRVWILSLSVINLGMPVSPRQGDMPPATSSSSGPLWKHSGLPLVSQHHDARLGVQARNLRSFSSRFNAHY